jgi:ADP-L-glycero-D-manno-heptose 6-epimerase
MSQQVKPKTFLVTGGAGLVGSNLAIKLQEVYPTARIVVIDDFSSGTYKNLDGFKGDVLATELGTQEAMKDLGPFSGAKIDAVFHQAALTDTTVHDEVIMMRKNVESLRQMIMLCLATGSRLIYASSSAVYGQHAEVPMVVGKHETPLNIYAFSKIIGDNLAQRAIEFGQMRIVGLRYFNVYGPREKNKGKAASMIYQIYRQLMGENIAGDIRYTGEFPGVRLFKHSGDMQRDWIHVDDVVNANILAMEARPGIYNIGTGRSVTFKKLVEIVGRELNLKYNIHYFKNPAPEYYQKFTQANIKSTQEALNGYDTMSISKGIHKYVQWLKGNNER